MPEDLTMDGARTLLLTVFVEAGQGCCWDHRDTNAIVSIWASTSCDASGIVVASAHGDSIQLLTGLIAAMVVVILVVGDPV